MHNGSVFQCANQNIYFYIQLNLLKNNQATKQSYPSKSIRNTQEPPYIIKLAFVQWKHMLVY